MPKPLGEDLEECLKEMPRPLGEDLEVCLKGLPHLLQEIKPAELEHFPVETFDTGTFRWHSVRRSHCPIVDRERFGRRTTNRGWDRQRETQFCVTPSGRKTLALSRMKNELMNSGRLEKSC